MWDALIDGAADLFRGTISRDASGGRVITYPSTATLSAVAVAIQPASSRDMDAWARRDIVFSYWVFSTADFDSLLPGGLKLNDKFVQGGVSYVVQGYLKQLNQILSDEPLYQIQCQRVVS